MSSTLTPITSSICNCLCNAPVTKTVPEYPVPRTGFVYSHGNESMVTVQARTLLERAHLRYVSDSIFVHCVRLRLADR